tara:strand:- start:342 stop:1127 length:786 start_codon:yes stop_codon:yes gene_type:complete
MLALVSPAKKLDFEDLGRPLSHTEPDFLSDTRHLVARARKLKKSEIQQLMNLSDDLTDLNYKRFKAFSSQPSTDNAKQAVMAFAGDTYIGLDSATLAEKDLNYAQDHLRILSGLYGLLRPLDLIQPYRLEMGRRLTNKRGENLYDFWGDKLAKGINKVVKEHQDSAVINLASNEYFKAANKKAIKSRVITPVFKEIKGDREMVIGFLAKKARGTMTRFMLQNRIENSEDLKSFTEDRFKFQSDQSDENKWVFSRKFIPVAG